MVRVRELAGVASVVFAAMGVALALQAAHIDVAKLIGRAPSQTSPVVRVAALAPALAMRPSIDTPAKINTPAKAVSRTAGVLPAPIAAKPAPSAAIMPLNVQQPIAQPAQTIAPEGQAEDVALRVRSSVPANLYPYFDMFLYVSKAAAGPWAQHMYVFHKGPDGQLVFEESFLVSTGRELHEKYFTSTPAGLFELDPNRFDRKHFSHRWHGAPMPWAMFWNYTIHGHLTGVALHSGIGHVALLGRRASGGCVRLPPEKAQMLFKRIQAGERGMVPVFALDPARDTTSVDGVVEADATGNPLLAGGYKVLVIVQDYPGAPAYVATLS